MLAYEGSDDILKSGNGVLLYYIGMEYGASLY
jgi:hypothetical protein